MDPATDVGPLANESQVKTIAEQVERSVAAGARVVTGGRRLDGRGYYYTPTVLTGVTPDSPAYYDEVFGPVATIFRVRTHRRGDPGGQRLALRPRRQRVDHAIRPSGRGSSPSSRRAWCSSMRWWRPIHGCRSAG